MKATDRIDLGSVQVDKSIFDEIITSAVGEIDGVQLIRKNLSNRLFGLFGQNCIPGIDIKIDDKHEVTLEVKVLVRYGMNIPDAAKQIQEAIKSAVDKTLNVDLKKVNINVQGIARGKK